MDTVVSKKNYHKYIDNGIIPCLPRGQFINEKSPYFQSFGLCEIEKQLYEWKSGRPEFK